MHGCSSETTTNGSASSRQLWHVGIAKSSWYRTQSWSWIRPRYQCSRNRSYTDKVPALFGYVLSSSTRATLFTYGSSRAVPDTGNGYDQAYWTWAPGHLRRQLAVHRQSGRQFAGIRPSLQPSAAGMDLDSASPAEHGTGPGHPPAEPGEQHVAPRLEAVRARGVDEASGIEADEVLP